MNNELQNKEDKRYKRIKEWSFFYDYSFIRVKAKKW